METCGTEEPYEGKPHVRICGGAGWATTGSTRTGDGGQRPLVPRSRCQPRLKPGVRCLVTSSVGRTAEMVQYATIPPLRRVPYELPCFVSNRRTYRSAFLG